MAGKVGAEKVARGAGAVGLDTLFTALAEPTRVRLIALLGDGETCVCDLLGALDLPQPLVSRHLGVLRRAGLVLARRDGRWMWYRLAPGGSPLVRALVAALLEHREELPGFARAARRCDRSRGAQGCCD